MSDVVLVSLGRYIPEKVVTNEELVRLKGIKGISPEEIRVKTSISERRFVTDETPSDMAVRSIKEAVGKFDGEIDDLFYVANTPPLDLAFPQQVFSFSDIPSSVLVPHARETLNQLALDDPRFKKTKLHAEMGGCAHFLMALQEARSRIRSDRSKSAVVVTSTDISRYLDAGDVDTVILFGDGACAALLRRGSEDEKPALLEYYEKIDMGKRNILYYERKDGKWYTMMDGKAVFKMAVRSFEDSIKYMESKGYPVSCIDHFCPHQGNGRILDAGIRKTKIPPEKVHYTLQKYGNTSSSSIGITLYEASRDIKPGEKVLLLSFGAGFVWNAMLLQY
jgi:3-oxoacyl-[acyl-carrier-protein] synthase-3